MLANLGIQTNGQSNTLTLSDSNALNTALANNLSSVKDFFSNATNGWATQFNNYLDATIGDNGTLITHQANLTKQSSDIDTQVANLEKANHFGLRQVDQGISSHGSCAGPD